MSLLSKRFPTIVGVLVLVAGVVAGVLIVNRQGIRVDQDKIQPKNVRITNVTDSKFTVSWMSEEAASGKVVYGKVGEELDSTAKDDRDKLASDSGGSYKTHHVTVEKLQPDTQYAFLIEVGEKGIEFDNNGSPYTVRTGTVITGTPPADAVYGTVVKESGLAAEGAIVYMELPGSAPLSTLVKQSGNWTIPLSTARTKSLADWVDYDPKATIFSVNVQAASGQAAAQVSTANANPVPEIVLGETYDFRTVAKTGEEVDTATGSGDLAEGEAETPGVFELEPLSGESTASGEVKLINPEKDGEVLATSLPEFRGTGSSGMVLNIKVESQHEMTDTVTVAGDGTWTWTPPSDLAEGEHTVTVAYVDEEGLEHEISRTFVVQASDDPAFESTPSASVSPSPTESATPSASTRESMPSTDSGVPASGLLGPTVTTGMFGILIMLVGAMLLII